MPIDRTTPVGRAAPIYRLTAHRLDRTRSMGRRPPSETRPPADKLIVTTPSSRSMARMGTDRRQKSDTDQAGIRPNTPSFPTKSRQDPSTNPADTSQKRGRHLARSQHEADTFSTRLKRFFSRLSSAPAQAHRSPRGHREKGGGCRLRPTFCPQEPKRPLQLREHSCESKRATGGNPPDTRSGSVRWARLILRQKRTHEGNGPKVAHPRLSARSNPVEPPVENFALPR